jgi:hypothetical protein
MPEYASEEFKAKTLEILKKEGIPQKILNEMEELMAKEKIN